MLVVIMRIIVVMVMVEVQVNGVSGGSWACVALRCC